MCKRCGESVDHLLFHCPIAWELWSLVFYLFGIQWVMPHAVLELFEAWQGKFARHRHIHVWRLVPHCLIWCIWRERNARSFEGCERSLLEIKSLFLHTLWMERGLFSFFLLFFLFFSWSWYFYFLICASIVHPQCTRFGNLSIINNILMLFIKKIVGSVMGLCEELKGGLINYLIAIWSKNVCGALGFFDR